MGCANPLACSPSSWGYRCHLHCGKGFEKIPYGKSGASPAFCSICATSSGSGSQRCSSRNRGSPVHRRLKATQSRVQVIVHVLLQCTRARKAISACVVPCSHSRVTAMEARCVQEVDIAEAQTAALHAYACLHNNRDVATQDSPKRCALAAANHAWSISKSFSILSTGSQMPCIPSMRGNTLRRHRRHVMDGGVWERYLLYQPAVGMWARYTTCSNVCSAGFTCSINAGDRKCPGRPAPQPCLSIALRCPSCAPFQPTAQLPVNASLDEGFVAALVA